MNQIKFRDEELAVEDRIQGDNTPAESHGSFKELYETNQS